MTNQKHYWLYCRTKPFEEHKALTCLSGYYYNKEQVKSLILGFNDYDSFEYLILFNYGEKPPTHIKQ